MLENEHPPIERIRLGPVDLKAAVVTNVVGDDITVRTSSGSSGTTGGGGGSKGDVTYGVTPAILLQYGTHEGQKGLCLTLVYSPTFTPVHPPFGRRTPTTTRASSLNALYPVPAPDPLNLTQTYTRRPRV